MKLTTIGEVKCIEGRYRLEIEASFREALDGLHEFSYATVLYWFHALDSPEARDTRVCSSPYRTGPASLGVFATRSPTRPNPIGATTIQIERLDAAAGFIDTPFIDALDGSPIVDLKPYVPALDRVQRYTPPGWCAHWPQWVEDSAEFDWQAELTSTPAP